MPQKSQNLDILDICNLSCGYCRTPPGMSLMGFDVFKEIIDSNKEIEYTGIGGGEPLMHPEFNQMILYILDLRKKIVVSSNLTTDVKKLHALDKNSINLQVSLPAVDQGLYAQITKEDLLEEVLSNINQVKTHLPTVLHFVVYQKNFENAEKLIDYSVNELQLPIRINLAYPVGNAKDLDILTKEQVISLTELVSAKRVQYNTHNTFVISGLRFTDPSCTAVHIPCPANANYFSMPKGACSQQWLHYDVHGNKQFCEIYGG